MSSAVLGKVFKLYNQKQPAIDALKDDQRLWGVDQHYTKQDGTIARVMAFFCASTADLIAGLLTIPSKYWNVYEIVREHVPCCLYMDTENHPFEVKDLVRLVAEFLRTIPDFPKVKLRVGVKDACNESKISKHILVRLIQESGRELRLADNYSAGALMRRFIASLIPLEVVQNDDWESLPNIAKVVDLGVYTKDRQMRLPGNDKYNAGRPTCPVIEGRKLTPEESLHVIPLWLIQGGQPDFDVISVTEADGALAEASSVKVLKYRRTRYPDAASFASFKNIINLQPNRSAVAADTPRFKSDAKLVLEPRESLYGVTPIWNRQEMPLDFFGNIPRLMDAVSDTELYPECGDELETTPFPFVAFNRAAMPPSQLLMMAAITRPSSPSDPEQAALDFMFMSSRTHNNLGELCALWLYDLTGDRRISVRHVEDNGFTLNLPTTKICHAKGMEHKSNKTYFRFNVELATATQYCLDREDCSGKPGTIIILPPNLKAAMCLAWHWRQLYLKSFIR